MNFMLTDDGKTLLAVRQGQDGNLELLTVPVTIVQNIADDSTGSLKATNIDKILNQNKLNHVPSKNIQQSNVLTEQVNSKSQNIQVSKENVHQSVQIQNHFSHKILEYNSKNVEKTTETSSSEKEQNSENLQSISSLETSRNATENLPLEIQVQKKLGRPRKNSKTTDEKAYLKCDICGQEFKKQYLMQKHMHEHSQEKPHHCPKCPASFNVPINFTLHMATHSLGEPKCPECGRKFARIASLKSHMLVHEMDENLYCTECEDSFETRSQLEAHLKLHNEKWSTDDYRKCKLCRKQFTQPALYRQHLRDHYKMQTKFTKQTKRGIRHRTVYKCKICMKPFEKPSQLVRHIRVHTGEKPYKCNLCNRSFTQKGSVRIHMWQHNGIRPYNCSFCRAKFSQKGNLNAHVLRVHKAQEGLPMYRCTQCPCIFKKLGSLNGHVKRMHCKDKSSYANEEAEPSDEEVNDRVNENEERINGVEDDISSADNHERLLPENFEDGFVPANGAEQTAVVTILDRTSNDANGKYVKIKQCFVNNSRFYQCSFCDKKFKKPSDLIRHLRIHTREKPFKCKICERSFTLKSTMLSHEKTHSETKKYTCRTCFKSFISESALSTHEKIHNKIPSLDQLKAQASTTYGARKNRRKKQFAPEVQNLMPDIILKEPLVLTNAGNGLLHAQPKFRYDIAHDKGRPHKCPSCPAAFMKLSHLKQHHRKHTGERPFVCPVCDRKFTTNSALKAHRRIHDLVKPYKCTLCNMNFTTLSNMKRHHVSHSNKRPYMCPYCNKTFKTTVNCRKHMKIHKQEIAQQELERQKKQYQSENSTLNTVETITIEDSIAVNNQEITFRPLSNNLSQNLNEHQTIAEQHVPVVNNPNNGQTQTLHADETGTVTLPNYTGDQTLTPQNIREIEETLNQQLFNIGMNFAMNTTRQIEEQSDNLTRDQPVLSIIYDDGKTLGSSINTPINTNMFPPQFDTFDINQMTLQVNNEVGMGTSENNSTNINGVLPQSIQENQCFNSELINNGFDLNTVLRQNMAKDNQITVTHTTNNIKNNTNISNESNLQCHLCNIQNFNTASLQEHLKTHQNNKEFECTHCFLKFCTNGVFNEHLKTHEIQETYKCYECNQEFPTTLQLREHIKQHVKKELELKKSTGTDNIIDDIQLKNIDGTNEKNKKSNECKYCPKTFRKPSDLIRHIRTHTGERPYQCQHCTKSFAVKCTLDSHLKVHAGEKSFHCNVCNTMYATKNSLKVHMRLHTGDKPLKCHLCDMRFRTSARRKVHLLSHIKSSSPSLNKLIQVETEKGEQVIQILQTNSDPQRVVSQETNIQDQSLSTMIMNSDQTYLHNNDNVLNSGSEFLTLNENNQFVANLQYLLENGLVTIQTDDDSPQLPNTTCDFVTTNITQKDQEQAIESQVIFTTQVTDTVESSATDTNNLPLNNCMVLQLENIDSTVPDTIAENDLKQTKSLSTSTRRECDVCGKVFAKPYQLERHKRTHTGERPFKCDVCNKAFTQKSSLQMHQKNHTGDRSHICPYCSRSFIQNGNLQTHLRRKHKVESTDSKRSTQQFINFDPRLLHSIDDAKVLNFDDISFVELLK